MRNQICILVLFFISVTAFGQYDTGNGGGGIVCDDKPNIELFDFYEARTKRDLLIPLDHETAWQKQLLKILDDIAVHNPERSLEYKIWLRKFEESGESGEVSFVDSPLPIMDDVGVIVVPENCKYKQIILQQEPLLPKDKRYVINTNLWGRLYETEKAALVFHEFVWRDVKRQGHKHLDARFVRYFVSKMFHKSAKNLSLKEYIKILTDSRMQYAQIQNGIRIELPVCFKAECSLEFPKFWNDNTVKSANVVSQFVKLNFLNLGNALVFLESKQGSQFLPSGIPEEMHVMQNLSKYGGNPVFGEGFGMMLFNEEFFVLAGIKNPLSSSIKITQEIVESDLLVKLSPGFPLSGGPVAPSFFVQVYPMGQLEFICENSFLWNWTKKQVLECY